MLESLESKSDPRELSNGKLSLVIPAWNEEAVIAQAVDEALEALARITQFFEIIIVDDGSTDGTAAIVQEIAEQYPAVRLVRLSENRGYGAALRAGFEAARYELVAFTDADCQFNLSNLEYMLPLCKEHDFVSGYRIDRQDSTARRFYSWSYNTLVKLLLQCPLRDVDCALKVFRREALLKILPTDHTYFSNTEMVTAARQQNLSVIEVGVAHRPRAAGESKVTIREIPRTLSALLPFWWRQAQFPIASGITQEERRPSLIALLCLMLIGTFLLFSSRDYLLIEPDEGRYAEIAREMYVSGDWIVPRLYGEPYLDKPPLFYWLCAWSYLLFGVDDASARVVPAIAAWLTILATYLFGCRFVGRRAALFGALAMTLSFGFMVCGRFLILDSVLTLFVACGLFTAHEAVRRERLNWAWWLASAVLCGLGVLTKGPVAVVLIAPPVVANVWLNRHQGIRVWRAWAVYLGVVSLIAAPWYVAVSQAIPGFPRHFLWEHNIQRFLSGSNHPSPIWFYVPVMFLGVMPWGLLLFPLIKYLMDPRECVRGKRTREAGFLALWSAWCLAFFSVSSSKLPAYILPCVPAVMLLLGHYVQVNCSPWAKAATERMRARVAFRMGTTLLPLTALVFAVTLLLMGLDIHMETTRQLAVWCTLLLIIGIASRRMSPALLCIVFCAEALFLNAKVLHDVFPDWSREYAVLGDSRHELYLVKSHGDDLPIACIAGHWGSVPFYFESSDVTLIERSEIEDVADFVEDRRRALLVVNSDVDEQLLQESLPPLAKAQILSSSPAAMIVEVHLVEPVVTAVVQTESMTTRLHH